MRTETNRETIRRAFVAWQDEGAPIADVFAPAMTWRIEGRSVVAGDYANRQEFIDWVLAPFGARFAEGEQFRPVRIHALCADGDTVIVRRVGDRRHRVFRQHRVRRALAALRRGGEVRLLQESRKPGTSALA